MEDICRICLSGQAEKDIFNVQANKKAETKNYVEIIMFCLGIQVVADSRMSTKLCLKCSKKILTFHKFKSLALKNDAFLMSLHIETGVKNEVFIRDDIKTEALSISDQSNDVEIKDELIVKEEDELPGFESDDEFLSMMKKIKYEYVVDDAKENVKENITHVDDAKENITQCENAPIKTRKKERKKNLKSRSKQPIQNVKQMCEECGVTVNDLKTHMYSHMPKAFRKRIQCNVCDKNFASYSAKYKHNKIKHLGFKQKCTVCNKVVTSLRNHYRRIHDPESLPHQCIACDRRFISKTSLDVHMTSHTKDRPFPCDVCEKKYTSRTLLIMHKRRVHDKEKPHLCQLCSKSFFKKYHLQQHLRSHSKEKPYECPECGKSFSTSSSLRSHRLIHGSEKTVACSHCDMTFIKQAYLTAHMISHTKEKRHPCQYCGVRFGRSDHRLRHERTAHQKHLPAPRPA